MFPAQVRANDLVGCRYRLHQRAVHPNIPPLPESLERQPRIDAARALVLNALPTKRAVGDGRRKLFIRVDVDPADGDEEQAAHTIAAIRAGAHVITNARLTGQIEGVRVVADVDVLVRDGHDYLPVIISNHRVARAHETSRMAMIPVGRLGLSAPLEVPAKPRHHTVDGYRLAIAEMLLRDYGKATGRGGVIGQDRTRAYIGDVERFIPPLIEALTAPIPAEPKRLKQCATCRFWELCRPRLEELDDISLVLPGGRGDVLRDEGITTVQKLISAEVGEPSAVARAWRKDIPLLRRPGEITIPRADVEIDIDMEAYLDQGAYLWGAFDGQRYYSFVTWDEVGGADSAAEERNFGQFWGWLRQRKQAASSAGKTFRAYCFAAGGENYWMRSSAKRFGSVDAAEVAAFLGSDEWVDVFAYARKHLVGTDGLGLKVLAPAAGYTWEDEDVDGERSIALRRAARLGNQAARDMLLRYNEDDCRATRAVRDFLSNGAPGVPLIDQMRD